MKPFSSITIDSRKINQSVLSELEDVLYGTDTTDPRLPPVDEILNIVSRSKFHDILLDIMYQVGNWLWNPFDFRNDTIDTAIRKWANESVVFWKRGTPAKPMAGFPYIRYWITEYGSEGKNEYYLEVRADSKSESIIDRELRKLGAKIVQFSAVGEIMYNDYSITY